MGNYILAENIDMANRYNRIKEVLQQKGKSQGWLAKELDKDKGTIWRWCRNDNQPSFQDFFKIAELLEINPSELLGDGSKIGEE